jgi:hypothetical protein
MENSGGGQNGHTRKVIIAPSLKRGKDETPINERVSGFIIISN